MKIKIASAIGQNRIIKIVLPPLKSHVIKLWYSSCGNIGRIDNPVIIAAVVSSPKSNPLKNPGPSDAVKQIISIKRQPTIIGNPEASTNKSKNVNTPINKIDMKETNFGKKVRKVLLNKYAITVFVFAVLLVFIGEQSLINQFSRSLEIRKTKRDIQRIQAETTHSERTLRSLNNTDSLERFAREQYNMHEVGEDVYIVE